MVVWSSRLTSYLQTSSLNVIEHIFFDVEDLQITKGACDIEKDNQLWWCFLMFFAYGLGYENP